MKNIIKIGLITSALVGVLHSCDNEGELPYDYVDLGANVILKSDNITRFDQNEDLTIQIITADGVSVNNIEVQKDDTKVTDATINGKEAVFNASLLAPYDAFGDDKDELYGSFNVSLVSTLSNGKTIDNVFSVNIEEAIKFSKEIENITYLDKDNEKEKAEIHYTVTPFAATLDKVVLEWKKNYNGTYAEVTSFPNVDEIDEKIDLSTLDYANSYGLVVGDTLYYKVTATKGSVTEFKETKTAIVSQFMDTSGSNEFSAGSKYLNFSSKSVLEADAEVIYTTSTISTKNSDIQFAELSVADAEAYFTAGDLFKTKEDFTTGSATSSVTGLSLGKLYAYKITRDSVVYYGLIKIGDVSNIGTSSEKVNILYKEGTLKL